MESILLAREVGARNGLTVDCTISGEREVVLREKENILNAGATV